jgi:glycosyltransferase involved in cell wall biosynthesis
MGDKQAELTIVVPAKNEEKYIGKLFDSILSQDYPEISSVPIYVADAQSADRTREIAAEYENKLNVSVIEGGLPSVGRNRGAAQAKTKYILFVDADVEFGDRAFLWRALSLMERKKLWCVAAYPTALNGRFSDNFLFGLNAVAQFISKFTKPYGTGMFLLFELEAFDKFGGFDVRVNYSEDAFLVRRVPRKRFGIVPGRIKTSNRRFKKTGFWRILWLGFQAAVSQAFGNDAFFYRDHKYFSDEDGQSGS